MSKFWKAGILEANIYGIIVRLEKKAKSSDSSKARLYKV